MSIHDEDEPPICTILFCVDYLFCLPLSTQWLHLPDQVAGNVSLQWWPYNLAVDRSGRHLSYSARHEATLGFDFDTGFSFHDNHFVFRFSFVLQNTFFIAYNNVMQKRKVGVS